jgi:hypothetical protein
MGEGPLSLYAVTGPGIEPANGSSGVVSADTSFEVLEAGFRSVCLYTRGEVRTVRLALG